MEGEQYEKHGQVGTQPNAEIKAEGGNNVTSKGSKDYEMGTSEIK